MIEINTFGGTFRIDKFDDVIAPGMTLEFINRMGESVMLCVLHPSDAERLAEALKSALPENVSTLPTTFGGVEIGKIVQSEIKRERKVK